MTLQNGSALSVQIGRQVIRTETNDGRFESFCCGVIALAEGGGIVVKTSSSWDMGRDGVGLGRSSGIYACTSLRDDVDEKALGDLARITSTTENIKKIYFCTSHDLSEYKRDMLARQLSEEIDFKYSVTVLGNSQLVEIASHDVGVLTKFYGAEIDDCIKTINAPNDDQTEKRGLRLALMSIGEDSAAVRAELYQSIVLEILVETDGFTQETLSNKISERLHLMRSLAKEALIAPLGDMQAQGLIEYSAGVYKITETGKRHLDQTLEHATLQLLDGRKLVRQEIEHSIGALLADDHFNKLWSIFEDRMVAYCISKGETLVAEVSELLGENSREPQPERKKAFSFVEEIAKAVSETSSSPQQRLEIAQAIKDIFHYRSGPATDWLVKLCMSFMAACSLGMEYSCGSTIEYLLKKTTLVLDTDVILSLLGEGENDNAGVLAIVNRWHEFGGKVLVGEPVLEEVAYHASIAQMDFEQVRNWLPGTVEEHQHIISNVFVRSFAELLARSEAKIYHWEKFIRQFKGQSPYDWLNVFQLMTGEGWVEKLPPRSSGEEGLEKKVREFLIENSRALATSAAADRNIKDKARRDAQLYAAIVSYLRSIRQFDPGATCLLVSSAHRLAVAEGHFKETAEPELITSISTVLHLLSLVPNVRLGASALKAFLFDERPKGFSSDFERTLMRMLRASDQVSLPWAKRSALMKSLREKMMQDAKSRGIHSRVEELEHDALTVQGQPRTIELMSQALDAVAVDSRTAKENADLRRRIAELEEQNRRQREAAAKRTPVSKKKR